MTGNNHDDYSPCFLSLPSCDSKISSLVLVVIKTIAIYATSDILTNLPTQPYSTNEPLPRAWQVTLRTRMSSQTSYKEDDTGYIIQTLSQNKFSIRYMSWVSMLYVAAAFTQFVSF